jgi:hypothetical protein
LIPGLIVEDRDILCRYVPFEEAGFNFTTVLISSAALSLIFSALKEALPILA